MKRKKVITTHITCRIPAEKKQALLEMAKKNGIDLSELIRLRLDDLPVTNQKLKNEFFKLMIDMTTEMNKIGTNINQITAGYNKHLKFLEAEAACESIREFNRLFKIYQERIDRLYFHIDELIKNG